MADLDGSNGFVINGTESAFLSGRSVSNAGDVNGDGFDDVIMGAGGSSFTIVNGGSLDLSNLDLSNLDLSNLDGSNGFVLTGIEALSVESVSSAGD